MKQYSNEKNHRTFSKRHARNPRLVRLIWLRIYIGKCNIILNSPTFFKLKRDIHTDLLLLLFKIYSEIISPVHYKHS